MKLYKKLLIPTDNTHSSEEKSIIEIEKEFVNEEFVMESDNIEDLKKKAEEFAGKYNGVIDLMWVYPENFAVGYHELTTPDKKYRYVIRP